MTADEFLAIAHDFQLGTLDTEAQHPLTMNLSQLATDNLPEAVAVLKNADLLALDHMVGKAGQLPALAEAVERTLAGGARIFLCGCGATGRLSMSVELFCREGLLPSSLANRVVAFMAGGDLALIKSVEKFEDHPEFGARQLDELGFRDGDLLIATTEGGETPWVIGAAERAAVISNNKPFFLYCNPDDKLAAAAERSRRVLENPDIHKINLTCGPMALSGSTRMQASTVQMAAIAFAIACRREPSRAADMPAQFRTRLEQTDLSFLVAFTEREAAIAGRGEYVLYEPGRFGITVLTDTTERSPTFSLAPFENQNLPREPASWCHLFMPAQPDAAAAWRALLRRDPRPLEWPEVKPPIGRAVLMGYDFSRELPASRARRTSRALHHIFRIEGEAGRLVFHLDGCHHTLTFPVSAGAAGLVETHLMLKLILNTHSTLLMGRAGRYMDNLMTWVKASNNKLIDRSIRYVRQLIAHRTGVTPAYEDTCRALFAEMDKLKPGEPVVLKTMERMCQTAAPAGTAGATHPP